MTAKKRRNSHMTERRRESYKTGKRRRDSYMTTKWRRDSHMTERRRDSYKTGKKRRDSHKTEKKETGLLCDGQKETGLPYDRKEMKLQVFIFLFFWKIHFEKGAVCRWIWNIGRLHDGEILEEAVKLKMTASRIGKRDYGQD